MSWRTMSSGFLCSLHAWFENIPEREERVAEREREQQREGKEKAAREREGERDKEREREKHRQRERENAGTESSFFPVARDRFKHCPCKEKDSKIPFGTRMGEQGYGNKEEVYLPLIQSNLSGRRRARLLVWGQQFLH